MQALVIALAFSIPGGSGGPEQKTTCPKLYTVGPTGLSLKGHINAGDPPLSFKLSDEEKAAVRQMKGKLYEVKLSVGKRYTISMDAAGPGLDSYLVVQNKKNRTLAFDDDSGDKLNARLFFDPPRTGTYKVYAAALNGTGPFLLKITEGELPKRTVNVVRQGFPAAQANPNDLSKSDTAWEIEWTITNPDNGIVKPTQPSSVLAIRSAKFMFKDSKGKIHWFTVLRNLEVAEILVPYDRLEPVFMDVSEHLFHIIKAKKEFLGPNCVLPGEILASADQRMSNKVMKEVHDDGLRWLDEHDQARRGEKMLIWAVFDGGNYRYLLEYGFRDDGVITCRLGATAHNLLDRQKDQRDVHLHVACWRFDPQLMETPDPQSDDLPIGGPARNRLLVVRRLPRTTSASGRFKADIVPFNANELGQSCEGFCDWKPEEFTQLRIESLVRKNSSKNPHFTAYDLMPLRLGSVRSYPWKYEFANHDFWVTRRDLKHGKFREVPLYASYSRPIEKMPVTVWHNAASYHVPRAEDYGPDGSSRTQGAAITTWAEFMLRPVNLFDGTPFYKAKPKEKKQKKK